MAGSGQVGHVGADTRRGFGFRGSLRFWGEMEVQGSSRCGYRKCKQRFDNRFVQKVEG